MPQHPLSKEFCDTVVGCKHTLLICIKLFVHQNAKLFLHTGALLLLVCAFVTYYLVPGLWMNGNKIETD